MKTKLTLPIGAVLILCAGVTSSAVMAACFDDFDGTWQGSGMVDQADLDAPQRLRCRLVTGQDTETDRSFSLRCATVSAARTLEFAVQCDADGAPASFQISHPVLRPGEASRLQAEGSSLFLVGGDNDTLGLVRNDDRIEISIDAKDAMTGSVVLVATP